MSGLLTQSLGWVATGVFVSSYFLRRLAALRTTQMCGAALWILHGFLIHATPLIAANAPVFLAAAGTTISAARGPCPPKR
jgi:hypothetical protein